MTRKVESAEHAPGSRTSARFARAFEPLGYLGPRYKSLTAPSTTIRRSLKVRAKAGMGVEDSHVVRESMHAGRISGAVGE